MTRGSALLLPALALASCSRDLLTVDDLDVSLRPGIVVPIGSVDLTLSDVFNPDSALVTVDPDQTYRLVYRQHRPPQRQRRPALDALREVLRRERQGAPGGEEGEEGGEEDRIKESLG